MQAPIPIIKCMAEGYKLPLLLPLLSPPQDIKQKISSSHHNADFVSSAIVELLKNNLRYLNQFLLKKKFKYEDLRVAT